MTAVTINGTGQVGETLSAVLAPVTGSATLKWQAADTASGEYSDIEGATGTSFELTASQVGKYIRVQATTIDVTGETKIIYSSAVGAITGIPVTAVEITGTAKVGETLTAAVTPEDATVSYQWKFADTADGEYSNIPGSTNATYTPAEAKVGKFVKVEVTGTGGYAGTILSAATAAIEAAG